MADEAKQAAAGAAPKEQRQGQPQVKIDTSKLKSSYCNISNVTSTREEVVINFGVNQNWDLGQKEIDVDLLYRVILSPHGAKRLSQSLTKLLGEYEARYGALS